MVIQHISIGNVYIAYF